MTPDIKYVGARGQNPTPFQTYAFTNDKAEHYSPDVRYEGDRAMRFNSDVSKTYGGQAGTGRGVKSDTYMDRTFPRTHATNVLINGSPAIRHGDLFDHNGSSPATANTIAKAQHPGPTDPKPAPKPSFWTRAWGALRVVGGAIEGVGAVAGEAGGGALDATGVGAVAGVPLNVGSAVVGANAIDNVWTGAKEVWYGTPQESLAQQGAGAVASGLGASQSTVDATKEVVGAGQGLIGGGPGGVADEASTVGREARALDHAAEEGSVARRTEHEVEEATESGEGGVRVAKKRFKNPCKHLAKGDPKGPGPYRGGSKDGTTGLGSNLESNHVPAWNGGASDTGLSYGASPSGAMDKMDHRDSVSSTGSSASAEAWRTQTQDKVLSGNYRDAVAQDYRDLRRVAAESGDPKKYNQMMKEMSAYRKCLEQHGLLPGK
ncbi:MAG: DUF4150 domain-containing protein [Beijerinckiaceae bacterium]|nr:DUF4150 domain-containing protein [Beijerinckiaceae bacterium]